MYTTASRGCMDTSAFCTAAANYPKGYCEEIRQIITYVINLYFPKGFHRPNHSTCVDE